MKIVTISDSPTIFSGLARVHRHVIDGLLADGHSVLPCGWYAYDEDQLERAKKGEQVERVIYSSPHGDIPVLNVPKGNGHNDMYAIYDVVRHISPDVVITIGDHWHFWYMRQVKIKSGFSFSWLPYLTIEHDELEPRWQKMLRYADSILVPSLFGQEVVRSFCSKSRVKFIPYGTEPTFRRPSKKARNELRKEYGCAGKVRFITVAQNTFRKNLPALAQAVRLIAHRDPQRRMQFYLHTNIDAGPREEAQYDLRELVSKLGIKDRFVFPDDERKFSIFESPDDAYMAEQYALSDFFVLPSTCEGFGLPVTESMACGVIPIANSSSTIPEHLGAQNGKKHGISPRGFLVGNRTEIYPPCRFLKVVRPEALGQAIWEAFQMTQEASGRRILEGMRGLCEEYGKGRTWDKMKLELCDEVRRAGKPAIPLEEL